MAYGSVSGTGPAQGQVLTDAVDGDMGEPAAAASTTCKLAISTIPR